MYVRDELAEFFGCLFNFYTEKMWTIIDSLYLDQ